MAIAHPARVPKTVEEFQDVNGYLAPAADPVAETRRARLALAFSLIDDRKRAAARNALRERKSEEAFQDWLRQLRDRAYVEYRLEDR